MEFEEMVNLFITFDANKSGTIDRHEAKKILSHLGIIR
jgi:Ca2+-binding EF-hand superfamily protein